MRRIDFIAHPGKACCGAAGAMTALCFKIIMNSDGWSMDAKKGSCGIKIAFMKQHNVNDLSGNLIIGF